MFPQATSAKEVFLAALELPTPAGRTAFLEKACAQDPDLRRRVEALLQAHDGPGSFLNSAPGEEGPTEERVPANAPSAGQPRIEGTGTRIGPYKLLQEIGEGGMGVVFMAEQEHPVRRRVALKIVKPGMDSRQIIARFEAERQALAMMDHLNIARVLDANATQGGQPYFVMELIHGVSITRYCDENRLNIRERLELFVPVCQAIQHAHQKGIIHRDVKPSNFLVTLYDGKPVPKVIDFGVAKATEQRLSERTMFTEYGTAVGTFEYMSPEQAEMSALGVDTRSDIYSLGVLLYELLTGTTPLEQEKLRHAGFSEKVRMIREEEPRRPSAQLSSSHTLAKIAQARKTDPAKLMKLVKGELDWIVMKCLEKDRTRRYETANGLARDVQRYLADEAVEACPPSNRYRLGRFACKYRKGLVAIAAFLTLLVLAAVVSTWQAVRAARAERQMQVERDRARMALTRQVAERLDGVLQQLAGVGDGIEEALAQRKDWTPKQLENWLRGWLEKDDRIHGLTLAFEPFQFEGKENYCLYVCRSPHDTKKLLTKDLLPPLYTPLYREWDWYRKPFKEQRPLWVGPCFDAGGGDVWMVSYSIPMRRGEDCVGVLSVDLPLDYFKRLWSWLEELNLGGKSYGFLINGMGATDGKGADKSGTFLSHPKYHAPERILELSPVDPAFAALACRMIARESDQGAAIDPYTAKRATFLFVPVKSAVWSLVVVVEESAEKLSP